LGRLFDRICTIGTLRQAWKEIQRKGAQGGIDGVSVAEFGRDAEEHLQDLAKALHSGRYSPEPAERIHTPKFNAAREFRPLSLPTVKDKIAQQAVRMVIEPLFERRFLDCNYAYRANKGPRKAVARVTHYITNEKRNWAIFGDLDNFFDSLSHERLLQEVQKVIYEPEILTLIRMWMKIGAMDQRGRYHDMDLGIAQGGIVSPLLSNVYAHCLDEHLVVAHKLAYIRYADNFITLCRSRDEAAANLDLIRKFIEENLHLRLNPEKEPIRDLQRGFVFLGVFFQGEDRCLAREKREKIRRKLDWLTNKSRPHAMEKILNDVAETVDGVFRYYDFLNPWNDFRELDEYLLRRLKVLLVTRRERGELKVKREISDLLRKLPFFAAREDKDAEALRKRLTEEVFAAGRKPPELPRAPKAARSPAAETVEATMEEASAAKGAVREECSPQTAAQGTASPARQDLPWSDAAGNEPLQPLATEVSGKPAAEESTVSAASGESASETPSEGSEHEAARAADRKVASKKRRYVKRSFTESELVIHTPGTFIGYRSGRVVMTKDRKKILERPLIKVKSILIHARGVSVSSDLVEACSRAETPIVFSTPGGRSYASIHAPLQSKPDLGLLQLQAIQDGSAFSWAKAFVLGKLKNQLNLLKFYLRHREDEDPDYAKRMDEVEAELEGIHGKVRALRIEGEPYEEARNQLLGFEGHAAVYYWEMVRMVLPEEIDFPGRVTYGAKDLVNASLNLGYSLLYPRVERALLLAGLNLYTSLFHAAQPGKPTLTFDFIEPFRAPAVDRAVFSLLTRGRDLAITTQGRLSSESVKMIIEAVVGRLGTLVPYKKEKITLEQVIHKQARLLARSLRGEKKFKAFISRY
jgi:CRISPR-associated protein Cas1